MKNDSDKKKKRRLAVFGTLSFLVLGYALYNLCFYVIDFIRINNEYTKLEIAKNELLESEQDLKLEINRLNDPEYVARYARENYYYSKDGEYIIKVPEKEEKVVNNNDDQVKEVVGYIVGGTSVLGLFLFIITRKR